MTRTIESKDGKRIWTITERGGRFESRGVYITSPGYYDFRHRFFPSENDALDFCREICGPDYLERVDA